MASEIGIPYWIKRQSIKLRAPLYHSDADTLQHIQQSRLLQWSKWQIRDICNQNNICHVYFFQCKIRETASSMHSSYYHTPRNTPSTTARILGINPPSWTESTSMNADKNKLRTKRELSQSAKMLNESHLKDTGEASLPLWDWIIWKIYFPSCASNNARLHKRDNSACSHWRRAHHSNLDLDF